MKEGKVIFIDKSKPLSETELEKLKQEISKEKFAVEFASDFRKNGFYSLSEALLALVQKGAKKVSVFPLSLGNKFEVPLYWGTY